MRKNNSIRQSVASVTISAEADAPFNPISKVDFYADKKLLGSVSKIPFTLTATGLNPGKYLLTAVATDGSGFIKTGAPFTKKDGEFGEPLSGQA